MNVDEAMQAVQDETDKRMNTLSAIYLGCTHPLVTEHAAGSAEVAASMIVKAAAVAAVDLLISMGLQPTAAMATVGEQCQRSAERLKNLAN